MKKYFCFQGLFKNIGLKSVAKNFGKNTLNFDSQNVTMIVSKMRVLGQKNYLGEQNAHPPACLGLKKII